MAEHHEVTLKKSSRRPDIDVIRIVLTWGILVYHTALIYGPYLSYYVRIIPDSGLDSWTMIYFYFIISMNAWNMPMFFFLSGIRKRKKIGPTTLFFYKTFFSVYFGLKKRTERQFREERLHRLLVPAFTLSLTASFLCSQDYFSKLSPNCQQYYHGENIRQDFQF